jgi:hypothetical protein
MYRFFEFYRIYEHVVGIFVLFFLTLYALHCIAAGNLVSLGQFGEYIKGLAHYLWG